MGERKQRWTVDSEDGLEPYRSDRPPTRPRAPDIKEITREQLPIVFQPIVQLDEGVVFAQEALVRCQIPEYANPLALFNAAATQGMLGRLGRTIREVTFERGAGFRLFVNVHPSELNARWLVRPDDPVCFHDDDLFLEITETAALAQFDLCDGVLREVCARTGAKLVIDDFGAGYSNLERIVRLEPAVVKLDRALIAGLDESPRKRTLVRHVVALCEDLGAQVVAEGVEQIGELEAVRDAGAHFAQGFLLARPGWPPPAVDWPL